MIEVLKSFGRARISLVPAGRAVPGAAAVLSVPSLPAHEFVHLFHTINALNPQHRPLILQFVASACHEGTTTIASGFAEAAASRRGKPVLLVDCNATVGTSPVGRFSASLIEAFDETSTIDAAIQPVPGFSAVSLAQLTVANETLRNVDYGDLRRLFDLARQKFSIIILDCPPATEAPDLLALARYSDGTVFVVRADATSRRVIAETKQAIERFGGQILGVVFNQRRSYIPRWMQWWFS